MRNFSSLRGGEFSRGKTLDPFEWVVERNSPRATIVLVPACMVSPLCTEDFCVNLIF